MQSLKSLKPGDDILQEVQKITGASDKDVKRIFLDRYRPKNPNTKISVLGDYRDKLFQHLNKNNLTNDNQ